MKTFLLFIMSTVLLVDSFAQQSWEFSVSAGAISPNFLVDSPLGYHIEGKIYYELTDSLQISLSSGFNSWKEELGKYGSNFNNIPLLIGVRIPFLSNRFSPYLTGELGVHFIKRDYVYEEYETTDLGLYKLVSSYPSTEHATKLAFRFSIGALYSLSKRIALDFAVRYNRVAYEYVYIYPTQTSKGSLNVYSFIFGINYKM